MSSRISRDDFFMLHVRIAERQKLLDLDNFGLALAAEN